ncbi:MAG: lipopolysaccharide core biosynthesis protein [Mucilaginibacter sp.]|nr:lipopolysaccharide core biosynthesis protein [Mucilaginibacter sp.]
MLRKITLLIYIVWLKLKFFFSFKGDLTRILIIKTDAIGDYIIFRNFMNEIAESEVYKDLKITLVCSVVIKDLAIELDGCKIEKFIYVENKPSSKNWFRYLKEISKFKYHTIINFHYSRDLRNELIAFAASANKKITMDGDYTLIKPYFKMVVNSMYSSLVSIPESIVSEFEINKVFTENIISKKLNYTHPQICLLDNKKFPQVAYSSANIIIAPGAGESYRQFSPSVLYEIVLFLTEKYSVCFIGTTSDTLIVDGLKKRLPPDKLNKFIDLTGKTSLRIIPYIITNSLCVIGNDSGIYHMSVALNKSVICIAGGGHFKRFVNYKQRANIKICYFPMPCFDCNWNCIYTVPLNSSYPCVSSVSVNDILEKFKLIENAWS